LRDLVALTALPAVWTRTTPGEIAASLAGVLLSSLHLDLVYVALEEPGGAAPIEVARCGWGAPPDVAAVRRALEPCLAEQGPTPASVPHPAGSGWLRIAVAPVGTTRKYGVVAAGSRDADFPSRLDRLLLGVGVNQAAIALESVRLVVSEQHARAEAQAAERRLGDLVHGVDAVVWEADAATFRFTFVSRRAEQILGYPAAQWLGERDFWAAILHPEDRDRALEACRTSVREGHDCSFECRARAADGRILWLHCVVFAGDESAGARRLRGVMVNVTDRKLAEDRLRQSQKLESIGLLAGGIAHDFNNLLVGMLGGASFTLDMLPPDHPARPVLEVAVKSSQRAADLTRQLLAYAGKAQFYLERVHLTRLVRQITGLIETSLPKNAQLRMALEDDLPPVEADPAQLQQLVMNLVINAAEAIGQENSGVVVIGTGVRELSEDLVQTQYADAGIVAGRYVSLEVSDTGCGMDAATQARIFDPFFTTKFTGRGLGLAAVSGIVRGHRGAIRVASAPGRGTAVRVLLPAARGAGTPG
jgi:PAS domain S-box-containing protein